MTPRLITLACLVVLAACGDNGRPAPADGTGTAVESPCAAKFSENFTEAWAGPVNCAAIETVDGHTTLQFAIPSQKLASELAITIDLGEAPAAGTYTSQTLATPWSADALHEFEMTSCLYHAGTAAIPPGTFKLDLDAIGEQAHGTLDMVLYVLARPYTYCGETNIEHLSLTF